MSGLYPELALIAGEHRQNERAAALRATRSGGGPRRFSRDSRDRWLGVLLAIAALASLVDRPDRHHAVRRCRAPSAALLGAPADARAAREQLVLIDIRLPRTLLAHVRRREPRHGRRHDAGPVPQSARRSGLDRRVVGCRARRGRDDRARQRHRGAAVAAARRLRSARRRIPRRHGDHRHPRRASRGGTASSWSARCCSPASRSARCPAR